MAAATTQALKKVLFEAYEGFADKRIKNLDKSDRFIVDDRGSGDYDARHELFLWFCQIIVDTVDAETIVVTYRGDVPTSPAVAAWFEGHGAVDTPFGRQVTIKRGGQTDLTALAQAIAAIVASGARYPVRSWKYVCPRTAASTHRLAKVLDAAWAQA